MTDGAVLCERKLSLASGGNLPALRPRCPDDSRERQGGQAIPDVDVLAFAVAEQRIVVTLNRRHFIRLHSTMPEHAGIVVCTFDPDFAALTQRIHTALEAQPQMVGQLIRVNRPAV